MANCPGLLLVHIDSQLYSAPCSTTSRVSIPGSTRDRWSQREQCSHQLSINLSPFKSHPNHRMLVKLRIWPSLSIYLFVFLLVGFRVSIVSPLIIHQLNTIRSKDISDFNLLRLRLLSLFTSYEFTLCHLLYDLRAPLSASEP